MQSYAYFERTNLLQSLQRKIRTDAQSWLLYLLEKKTFKQSFFVFLLSLLPQQLVHHLVVPVLDLAQRWANKNGGQ